MLVAAGLDDELMALVHERRAQHIKKLEAGVFHDAAMIFIGTGCPGISAAAAASAALGESLTERGKTDTFIIATGTGCADNAAPDCTRFARPRTTTALNISTRPSDQIGAKLAEQGFPASGENDICVYVFKPTERLIKATRMTLSRVLKENEIRNGAVLLVKRPRDALAHSEAIPAKAAQHLLVHHG
ncbi:hypothetical protein [Yoonia sp. 208BN28-4]|uniref:hypothetical protein n=1 Tax=Yoonia sp. 208BN28-4 TaxID=3126505 RepID=UPI003095B408